MERVTPSAGRTGAGKSTLAKLLAGIVRPGAGQILVFGQPAHFDTPRAARAAGVRIVHQELSFCENMTVAENLCLGDFPQRYGFVDRAAMRRRAGH